MCRETVKYVYVLFIGNSLSTTRCSLYHIEHAKPNVNMTMYALPADRSASYLHVKVPDTRSYVLKITDQRLREQYDIAVKISSLYIPVLLFLFRHHPYPFSTSDNLLLVVSSIVSNTHLYILIVGLVINCIIIINIY